MDAVFVVIAVVAVVGGVVTLAREMGRVRGADMCERDVDGGVVGVEACALGRRGRCFREC